MMRRRTQPRIVLFLSEQGDGDDRSAACRIAALARLAVQTEQNGRRAVGGHLRCPAGDARQRRGRAGRRRPLGPRPRARQRIAAAVGSACRSLRRRRPRRACPPNRRRTGGWFGGNRDRLDPAWAPCVAAAARSAAAPGLASAGADPGEQPLRRLRLAELEDAPAAIGRAGRGRDRCARLRPQLPRRDVGDGAAAGRGADRRLCRCDVRARMRRHRARRRIGGAGPGGRRPGHGLCPGGAEHAGRNRGRCGRPDPAGSELRRRDHDAGRLRHRDLCAGPLGAARRRGTCPDPCGGRRRRPRRDPIRQASRRHRRRHRRVAGQAGVSAAGRRRPCARFARSRLCRSRCARSPAGRGSTSC